jgi:predicted dehydrogenase
MYKGAIVGFGQVAEFGHVAAFKKRSRLFDICACVDSETKRLETFKGYFPKARVYPTLDKLLLSEKQLDFIDIATPPTFHVSQVIKCLKKGLHVLCEKPLVLNGKDFKKISTELKKSKKCLFTIHNWKKAPPILKTKQLIDKGLIGNPLHLELHVLRSQPAISATAKNNWRQNPKLAGGGITVDHGWHNFYLAAHLLGQEPKAITSSLSFINVSKGVKSDNISANWIDFENATALVYMTWKSPVRKNTIIVYGDKGLIRVDDDTVFLENKNGKAKKFKTAEKLSGGSAHPTWMTLLLDDFYVELKGKDRGHNFKEAKFCINLMEGAYKSAKDNMRTDLKKQSEGT